ncbi:hypothetical protein M0805_003362 [Coniferiporia weirii]|nr:hypothetical protein M0805_003362 [Coniferiporia weirii]
MHTAYLPVRERQRAGERASPAIAAVSKRLALPGTGRSGKDEGGKPMSREELTVEVLTRWIAGSDTTSRVQKAFSSFSFGPRAYCMSDVTWQAGSQKLLTITLSIFQRYGLMLEHPKS